METTLPSNVLLWLSCYLHGRSASCQFRQARSGFRSVGAGVPQGSVISPCLFNFFVSDYPHTADLHSSYADDFTAVVSDHNIHAASQRMSDHAADALQWAADRGLQVSVNKSNCTLFTSEPHTSPSLTLLCPATATLFPSAGPRSFLVSPLIPTSPSLPTSGEWPNVPAPALASSRPWQGWAGDRPRRSSCSPTRC